MLQKILIFVLLLIIAIAAFLYILSQQQLTLPEHSLEHDATPLVAPAGRKIEHVTLHGKELGEIGIIVNYPDPLPKEKLPVIIVLGGLANGETNLKYITNPGKNVIIGYDWPIPVPLPKGAAMLYQTPKLYHGVMLIPGQVATAARWASEQAWADNKRVSLLGFSLGAIAAPSTEHLAEQDGIHIGWTILAYGGAPLGDMVAANPHLPILLRYSLPPLTNLIFKPVEPLAHLPYLESNFLILEGSNDNLIPELLRENLRNAVPEPKQVIYFNSPHMGVGPDKLALLKQIIDTSTNWLVKSGAANNIK